MEEVAFYLFCTIVLIGAIVITLKVWNYIAKVRKVRLEDECNIYAMLAGRFKRKTYCYDSVYSAEYSRILDEANIDELRHNQRLLKADLGSTWAMALSYTISSVFLSKILPFFVNAWNDVEFVSADLLSNLIEAIYVGSAIWILFEARNKYKKESYFLGLIENAIVAKEKHVNNKKLEEELGELQIKVDTINRKLQEKQKKKNKGIHITIER